MCAYISRFYRDLTIFGGGGGGEESLSEWQLPEAKDISKKLEHMADRGIGLGGSIALATTDTHTRTLSRKKQQRMPTSNKECQHAV